MKECSLWSDSPLAAAYKKSQSPVATRPSPPLSRWVFEEISPLIHQTNRSTLPLVVGLHQNSRKKWPGSQLLQVSSVNFYFLLSRLFGLCAHFPNHLFSLGICLLMCHLGKLQHSLFTFDRLFATTEMCSVSVVKLWTRLSNIEPSTQDMPPRWCVTSPTGPSIDLAKGSTCPRMWTPSCAPPWSMPFPSSTAITSWLLMNGTMRPCTRRSMA